MFYVYNFIYCCVLGFGISKASDISTLFNERITYISPNLNISNSNLTELSRSNSNNFPSAPQNFEIEYITTKRIKLKWKIDRESLKILKGFWLEVTCLFGICNFNESENYNLVPVSDRETNFELDLNNNYGSYEIVLTTLPYKRKCLNSVHKTSVILIGTSSNRTVPFLFFSLQNQILQVNFTAAPKNYHINQYKICLKNETNSTQCTEFENPPAKFENVINGKYDVTLLAFDDSSNDEDENNCTNCIIAETTFTADQVICKTNKHYVYPLLVGIFIAIFSILIIGLLFRISRLKRQKFEKKLVLLLHTVDNEFHAKTVENFIKCLEYFNIIVDRPSSMKTQEHVSWLISTFDNVLLLDSIALGMRQEAWAVGMDYRQFLQEPNSKDLTKALFSVIGSSHNPLKKEHFLRCKWIFVPEDAEFKNYPTGQPSFVIPDDFKNLIEMIQGCSVDTTVCKTQMGILKDSIVEESKFIKENPNWFFEKYGTSNYIETEPEILDQRTTYPVLNDLISHVSSQLQKINQTTDNNLEPSMISGSRFEVISV